MRRPSSQSVSGEPLVKRRTFLGALAAAPQFRGAPLAAAPFPIHFRRQHPYEVLYRYVQPGLDEFPQEKQAFQIAEHLKHLPELRALPLAPGFHGISPLPVRYTPVAEGVGQAEYDRTDSRFEHGLQAWLASLREVRTIRFFVLPEDLVRYEVSSGSPDGLHYRVGYWKQVWSEGRLRRSEPVEETLVSARSPLFEDITARAFAGVASFDQQLLRGVPWWRARLDAACGIDVYGANGIAVGDIDGDGWDEIYVCQPGGLPNRLYKNRGDGRLEDITARAGLGVLDETSSALFFDLRNTGLQDLVVLRTSGPLLFLNQGDATFRHKPEGFRFAKPAQGSFTGMSAADYDRDGRLDLYLCSYLYYQTEDPYPPVPYHDARNGPPNFLFRNELSADGGGCLRDVTAEAGLNHNNDRFSFAASWCDYNGDGWPDLYVANDFGRSNLYRNDGGHFRDVAAEAGAENIGPGMSAAWFDYDGDRRPDLYVSNMWSDAGQRIIHEKAFTPKEAYRLHTQGNALFRNRGDGRFERTDESEVVQMGRWAWSADGLDWDNDGAPEIYIAAGMLTNSSSEDLMSFFWRQVVARSPAGAKPAPEYENGWNAINQLIREDYSWSGREPNVYYARRNGRYYDFSGVSGLDFAEDSRAFAATDFDGDGNLDLILKSRLGPQVRVLRNECGVERNSLALRLRGTRSNRDAIGARVEVDGAVKFVQAGSGYLSQHTKQLFFGLGPAAAARTLSVTWPSGLRQEFGDLAAGFVYDLVEGSPGLKRAPFRKRTPFEAAPALRPDNEPRAEAAWLLEPVPLPEPHKGPGFLCLMDGAISGPFQTFDLSRQTAEVAASYALFRRYLFDWRADLTLPLLLLIDQSGRAHRVYFSVPEAAVLEADRKRLGEPDRDRLALPFAGRYYSRPRRNFFRLGTAFYWAGYPEQALRYLEEAIHQDPNHTKALVAAGRVHLEAGRHNLARQHLERALAVNPQTPEAWNNLGGLEMAAGNYRAALGNYQKALSLRGDRLHVLFNAGQAYLKLGDREAAERVFRRVGDADSYNQLGLLAAEQNRPNEARNWFQEAIRAQRNHAGAINNLGVLYMQLGQADDALAALQYGIGVAPEEDALYLNLSRLYLARGERDKARDTLQRLLARKPNSQTARRALAELE
jgi:tetratricopeptide (TPR) repeat protein